MFTAGDLLVMGILLLIIGAILLSVLRKRRKPRRSGCGSCTGCAMSGSCPHQ